MEEILYELRGHAAVLKAGRWDYTFSLIKNCHTRGPRFVLPDRCEIISRDWGKEMLDGQFARLAPSPGTPRRGPLRGRPGHLR